jgi:hypothetical protein
VLRKANAVAFPVASLVGSPLVKLQRLTIDFAPNARRVDARLLRLEPYLVPLVAGAAATLAFLAWLLRE